MDIHFNVTVHALKPYVFFAFKWYLLGCDSDGWVALNEPLSA